MLIINIICIIFYFILLCTCAYTDYKKNKIYNKCILYYLLIFFIVNIASYVTVFVLDKNLITENNNRLLNNVIGMLFGFIICFLLYLLGVFKGGDAKLLTIVALVAGKKTFLMHYAMIMMVAGVCALYILIKNKILLKRLKRVFLYFKGILLTGHFEKYTTDPDNNIRFPFAVFILIGEIITYTNNFLRG